MEKPEWKSEHPCPKCGAYTLEFQTSSTMSFIPGGMQTTHFGWMEWCESCGYYYEEEPYELNPSRKYLRDKDGNLKVEVG